jgi:hypothetical protein
MAFLVARVGGSSRSAVLAAGGKLKLLPNILPATSSESRAQVTQSRDGGRHDGPRVGVDWHAIDSTKVAPRKGVRGRPEVGDGLAAVQLRSAREVFDAVNV